MPTIFAAVWLALLVACGDTSPAQQARTDCYGSCAQQNAGCDELNLTQCRALCDFVVALHDEDPACLQLAQDQWRCDQTLTWECHALMDIVARPAEEDACADKRTAYTAACSAQ